MAFQQILLIPKKILPIPIMILSNQGFTEKNYLSFIWTTAVSKKTWSWTSYLSKNNLPLNDVSLLSWISWNDF